MNGNALSAAKEACQIEAQNIVKIFCYIEENEFTRAVDALAKAERIASSGCGHSGIACRHFTHLMNCIERSACFIPPSEATHGGMGFVHKGDVMLLASRGGASEELLPILHICREKQVTVITVTENRHSPLAKGADIVLAMHVDRETDRYNCQGTTSFTVLSVIFDALQTALIEEIAFRNEAFARIHPGGAVGKRLNKN